MLVIEIKIRHTVMRTIRRPATFGATRPWLSLFRTNAYMKKTTKYWRFTPRRCRRRGCRRGRPRPARAAEAAPRPGPRPDPPPADALFFLLEVVEMLRMDMEEIRESMKLNDLSHCDKVIECPNFVINAQNWLKFSHATDAFD